MIRHLKTLIKKLNIFSLSLFVSFGAFASEASPVPFKMEFSERPNITAADTVYNMGFGWNLGNTLDATYDGPGHTAALGYFGEKFENAGLSSETCWGKPLTTKPMIKFLAESGIRTIRIPISWHCHITNAKYTIEPEWLDRVKQVVDWAMEEGLYVIIDVHHDNVGPGTVTDKGNGFCPSYKDSELSKKYLKAVWTQICQTFNNNYDEHLIFEAMNEPRLVGHKEEWWCPQNYSAACSTCKETISCINEYNQIILDTIRKSGGNNGKKRVVMFTSIAAAPYAAIYGKKNGLFKIPKDSVPNKLALSVHMYSPYNFAMNSAEGSTSVFSEGLKNELKNNFRDLNKAFISNGIPVVIGEMGATNKNNLGEREKWLEFFVSNAREYGMAVVLWDNGNPNDPNPSERFGFFNRKVLSWYYPSLIFNGVKAASN